MLNARYIKESAIEVGFDLIGVTFPQEFTKNRSVLEQWVASGAAQRVEYMQKYMDVRFNPANLMEGTRSVVVCAVNYKNQYSNSQGDSPNPKIASYAFATDYHKVVRKALKSLARKLQEQAPFLKSRCCVDTAPLLEKQLAVEAGLGWIGRQSLLVTPQYGTYVVLGVLLLDQEVDMYDSPFTRNGCGECRRCVDSCPSGAISESRTIDSRLCISALTIEGDSTPAVDLHGWVFGCDECQNCCPYNRHTPLAKNSSIQPIFNPISTKEWHSMSSEEFTERLNSTPLKRGGLKRIRRNCRED